MSEWQPIETAPKDGTVVLGCERHEGYCGVFDMLYTGVRWVLKSCVWHDGSCDCEPTHWMPLPKEHA